MAQSVLVIADSGSGKSTSGRNLDPKTTFWINIANKPLPFKGWKKNYTLISKDNPKGNMTNASSAVGIMKAIQHVNDKMPHITNLVIDDWQYMSAFEYFDKANEKGYDKFTSIASNLAQVAKMPKDLRDDLYCFFLHIQLLFFILYFNTDYQCVNLSRQPFYDHSASIRHASLPP